MVCLLTTPKAAKKIEFRAVFEFFSMQRYFSETIVTLEGIENKDRIEVLSGTQLERSSQETVDQVSGQTVIGLTNTIASRQRGHSR